jgi:hypothetical protein
MGHARARLHDCVGRTGPPAGVNRPNTPDIGVVRDWLGRSRAPPVLLGTLEGGCGGALQVVRLKARVLRDSREHLRADLLAIMERPDVVRPT